MAVRLGPLAGEPDQRRGQCRREQKGDDGEELAGDAVSWVTTSAPAMTKLPVTCATNSPNSARKV